MRHNKPFMQMLHLLFLKNILAGKVGSFYLHEGVSQHFYRPSYFKNQ